MDFWKDHLSKMQYSSAIHNIKMIRIYRNRSGFHRKAVNNLLKIYSLSDFKRVGFYQLIYSFLEDERRNITEKNKKPKPKWIYG